MIGAGSMANNVHYSSLASFADVRFAGVCDVDQGRLAATADARPFGGRGREVEGMARLYAGGDLEGVAYDTREVAGSDERCVYGGHRAKNREFIDSIKNGRDVTTSPFRDCVKTMDVAERILAHAVLAATDSARQLQSSTRQVGYFIS